MKKSSTVNLNDCFQFILNDDQSPRFIKAVFAGEPLRQDITDSFISQLDKACAVALEMNQSVSSKA